MTPPRIPQLRILPAPAPFMAGIWVVDENNHRVAVFSVKLPECHLKGATTETMNASLNLQLAQEFIHDLQSIWSTARDITPPNP